MASALSKQRDYQYMAEIYSEMNNMQVEYGKKLVALIGVKREDKVLDMGCGTGEVTAFIADQLDQEGQVVGVDPDQERIKVAAQKHCNAERNITFIPGDCSSSFPYHNKAFYDIFFSSFVFLWLTAEEKDIFLNTAFRCLKPNGRIAMQAQEKNPEIFLRVPELLPSDEIEKNRSPFQLVAKSVTESMLERSGFEILSSEYAKYDHMFPSLDCFLKWFCASGYIDEGKILAHKKQAFAEKFVNNDGTVYVDMIIYRIIAKKPDAL